MQVEAYSVGRERVMPSMGQDIRQFYQLSLVGQFAIPVGSREADFARGGEIPDASIDSTPVRRFSMGGAPKTNDLD
jgi:hypothetical protein